MKKLFGYIFIALFTLLLSFGYSVGSSMTSPERDTTAKLSSNQVSLSSGSVKHVYDIFRYESIFSPASQAANFARRIPVNLLAGLSGLVKNEASPFVNDYNTDRYNLAVLTLNKPQKHYYIYALRRIRI